MGQIFAFPRTGGGNPICVLLLNRRERDDEGSKHTHTHTPKNHIHTPQTGNGGWCGIEMFTFLLLLASLWATEIGLLNKVLTMVTDRNGLLLGMGRGQAVRFERRNPCLSKRVNIFPIASAGVAPHRARRSRPG